MPNNKQDRDICEALQIASHLGGDKACERSNSDQNIVILTVSLFLHHFRNKARLNKPIRVIPATPPTPPDVLPG